MNGEYEAVVERIVDGRTAVLRLEETGGERVEAELELLPPGSHEEGTRLTVTVAQGAFVYARPSEADGDGGGLLSRLFGR